MAVSSLLTPTLAVMGLAGVACSAPSFRRRSTWEEHRTNLLQERAAFDLQCSRPALRTQELGNEHTMGVAGCGRRAVYLYDYGRDAWVMNGAIDSEQAAAPGTTDTTNPPSPARREDASGNPGGTTL